MECPVDISGTELHSIGGQGSKGQRPLASLGTAHRLIPVHSGLPLCETCLSSAAIPYVLISSSFLHTYKRKEEDDSGFVGCKKDVKEMEILTFPENFYFRNVFWASHSGAQYRTIMCRIRHLTRHICLYFLYILPISTVHRTLFHYQGTKIAVKNNNRFFPRKLSQLL